MIRNSTLKLWDSLLKEDYASFDKKTRKILRFGPQKNTINNILAYARSVKGVKLHSKKEKILITLN